MSDAGHVDGVEVLWRPGCPFCSRLRRGLRRRGIATTEINIWDDPGAAERVRAVTGGDETVPTVFVGTTALVNPSVRDVVNAVATEFGSQATEILGGSADSGRRPWWSRMLGRESR
ncbi:glutaredoxin domain-containing protein [Mycolicibacterium pyrenivorans]|uniref:glutaredoxin domain-containing protein n=1 Tax=Mycolicibacterium pyrenivorans TaxID=187102 RepID=UPI0021F2F713|nr:glutaredoxin domain-containing protein [Mycolicibacterium pyrenivorans]MCV7151068.1 NrdH-redoxin [Mycolicibacterium pyrenivorans]